MTSNPKLATRLVAAIVLLAAGACSGANLSGSPATPVGSGTAAQLRMAGKGHGASGKITHVVVIVQENRSFDNLFAGYPGADTRAYGYASNGQKVTLQPVGLEALWDVDHSSQGYFDACDGSGSLPGTDCKMDGFDKEAMTCSKGLHPYCPPPDSQYSYVPHSETKPLFALAKQYVLADHMFTSNFDGSSFVSHQYIIAAQGYSTVDFPTGPLWGCDGGKNDTIVTITAQRTYGKPVRVCFDAPTLGDELDTAGISWRYYTSGIYKNGDLWNAYQAVKHIRYGADWKADVATPQTRFFKDIKNGELPAVSWVTPTCQNSDHAACGANHGPAWVASLVNAVGKSAYWNSTAIFIFWDDYGGWYDHVPPPLVDYDGLGIRVPLLIVSPYAKAGYVTSKQYEHGSILRFIEDQFGLPRLSASDARAKSPESDAFDFTQPPRAFKKIPAALDQSYFEREQIDPRPPDNE
jgi:phospholipase C